MAEVIMYYFSFNSPWSYLGDANLISIANRHQAKIVHKPTDFARVFPSTGGLPLPKRSPARKTYRLQELNRWRTYLDIPLITEPTHWPANERPSVGMILAGINNKLDIAPLASAILRALWAEDLNITDEKTLIKIAEDNGFDGANLIQESRNKELDLQWIANANDALDSGVFGAPSYVLGNQLFWGQDRLQFLERALEETTQVN